MMNIYDLVSTTDGIGKVDIFDNSNVYVTTLKKKNFKTNTDILVKEVKRWYIASISIDNITLGVIIK